LEALGFNLGFLILQILAFIIVFLTLNAWVYKPLLNMMEARKKKIAQGLEDARLAEERLANIDKDYQAKLDEARVDGQKAVAEMTANAEKQASAIVAKANEDVARIKAQAQEDAELQRNRALADLRGQVVTLSIAAANKLIGDAMDEKRQRALVDEFFSGVKSGKVMLLDEGVKASSVKAEVTSALPLSVDEQATIKNDLTSRGATGVDFKVDPKILGGLVVRMGDRVVDGSVSSQLEAMSQSLK
jgi:F-type H+-transporting ATPase subunit b